MSIDRLDLEAVINEQKEQRKTLDSINKHLEFIAERLKQYAKRDGLVSNKV